MNIDTPMPRRLFTETLPTPVGALIVVTDDLQRLRAIDWDDRSDRMTRLLRRQYGDALARTLEKAAALTGAGRAVAAYLAGDPEPARTLVTATGGTPFQQRVWTALRAIPLGQTTTYGELAARIGRPAAVRAVGAANGANPISVVVPCHRVVGANGALVGYAGGIERKQWLLEHERAIIRARPAPPATDGSWV